MCRLVSRRVLVGGMGAQARRCRGIHLNSTLHSKPATIKQIAGINPNSRVARRLPAGGSPTARALAAAVAMAVPPFTATTLAMALAAATLPFTVAALALALTMEVPPFMVTALASALAVATPRACACESFARG